MSWTLRQRNADLTPGIIFDDWSGTLVERWNYPDTLQVAGRYYDMAALLDPTVGVVLSDDTPRTRFSGVLWSYTRSGDGTVSITWVSDSIFLWDRDVYPTPANAWVNQTVDYGDVISGVTAEAAIIHYVNGNLGPGARAERQLAGLTVPAVTGIGDQALIAKTARLPILGRLIYNLAWPAGLTFNILQTGTTRALTLAAAPDLSASARYGSGNYGGPGVLDQSWSFTVTRPDVTAALVAGSGQGTSRVFVEADASVPILDTWGRIEQFIDQRQSGDTSDGGELKKAGQDAIDAASGVAPDDTTGKVTISAPILDSPFLRLGIDVPVGALVHIDLAGFGTDQRLRQLTTTLQAQEGQATVETTGLVGTGDATSDAQIVVNQQQFLKAEARIRNLEAST